MLNNLANLFCDNTLDVPIELARQMAPETVQQQITGLTEFDIRIIPFSQNRFARLEGITSGEQLSL